MHDKANLNQIRPDHIQALAEVSASLDLETDTILDFGSACIHLFLIYPEPCGSGCSYCCLSGGSKSDSTANDGLRQDRILSAADEMIARVVRNRNVLNRVCISTTVHPGSFADAIFLVERVARDLDLPVSIKINPLSYQPGDLNLLRDAGTGKIVLVLDTATENLFSKHRCESVDCGRTRNNNWETSITASPVL